MAEVLGFRNVSPDLVWALFIIALISAILMGYATDLLMRDAGFGILANTLIMLLGAGGAAVFWNSQIAPAASTDPVLMIGIAAGGALALLIILALVKRLR